MKNIPNFILCLFIATLLYSGCAVPTAMFSFEEPQLPAPLAEVAFENSSVNATTYTWDFGDKTSSKEATPTHKYTSPGEYTITLTAQKGKKKNISTQTISIEEAKNCLVTMETEFGEMVIKLFDETPLHRDNFLKLAEENYYDGLLFHRVIKGFMVQGGDPDSKNAGPNQQLGRGGPGYTVPAEIGNGLYHVKGALCAARQGDNVNPQKRSSGSQFYLVQGNQWTDDQLDRMEKTKGIKYSAEQRKIFKELGGTPHLDMEYTVFGQVIEGLDVIDKIADQPTKPGNRPVKDIKIKVKSNY